MKKWRTFAILFCIGGFGYNLVEVLWRGYSHWSMFLVGGGCFHLIGRIGARLKGKSLMLKSGLCALGVTVVEYITGCLVNRRWKLNVWDYSHMRGRILSLFYSHHSMEENAEEPGMEETNRGETDTEETE